MARVRVTGNFQKFVDQFEDWARAFVGRRGTLILILNDVEYFLFVEYGTSRQKAEAMVRRSMEPATRMFSELWDYLPEFFTPDDIDTLCELVKDYWVEEAIARTPERTGTLKRGMRGEVVTY